MGKLINVVIFIILYVAITSNVSFLKTLVLYIICSEIALAISLGWMSFSLFLLSFGTYFFSGIIILIVLRRVRDWWGAPGFIIIGTLVQSLIFSVISALA